MKDSTVTLSLCGTRMFCFQRTHQHNHTHAHFHKHAVEQLNYLDRLLGGGDRSLTAPSSSSSCCRCVGGGGGVGSAVDCSSSHSSRCCSRELRSRSRRASASRPAADAATARSSNSASLTASPRPPPDEDDDDEGSCLCGGGPRPKAAAAERFSRTGFTSGAERCQASRRPTGATPIAAAVARARSTAALHARLLDWLPSSPRRLQAAVAVLPVWEDADDGGRLSIGSSCNSSSAGMRVAEKEGAVGRSVGLRTGDGASAASAVPSTASEPSHA